MSTSFQEFLQKRAREELADDRLEQVKRWRDSVHLLLHMIRGWIESADPNHVLEVSGFSQLKIEQGLGEYDVEGLQIRLGSRVVKIVPIGRNVVGKVRPLAGEPLSIEGRVDITNGAAKVVLYRTLSNVEKWYVSNDFSHVEELDSHQLERILQELLS